MGVSIAPASAGGSLLASLSIPGQSYVPSSYGPATSNTRRGCIAMGGAGAGTGSPVTPTNGDFSQRFGFTIPSTGGATITRFRFRLRNSKVNTNTNTNGTVNVGGIYLGTPNVATESAWAGDFTATPTQVLAAPGLTELGTSEYVSPWITSFTLVPNKFYGLSYGCTLTGTAAAVQTDATPGWSWAGTGSAAAASGAAAPVTAGSPYTNYLDLRMEYEFSGTSEIGFFVSDSLGAGWQQSTTPAAIGHMGADNTWPHQAALRLGHHDFNGGVGGIGTTGWVAATTITDLAFTRWLSPESGYTTFASTPDYAVIGLNLNDNNGLTLTQFITNYQIVIGRLQALGIPRIYATTEGPGYTTSLFSVGWQAGSLTTIPANPMTSLVVGYTPGPGVAGGQPGPNNAWVYGGAGSVYLGTPEAPIGGPYTCTAATGGSGSAITLTVSGLPARPAGAAALPIPIMTALEYMRRSFNKYIRSLPPGITAILDFDINTTSQFYFPSAVGRQEFYDNTGDIHPNGVAMYSMWASMFVNGILGN